MGRTPRDSFFAVPLRTIIRVVKYISGLAAVIYGLQLVVFGAMDTSVPRNGESVPEWFSLPRFQSERIEEDEDNRKLASDEHLLVVTASAEGPVEADPLADEAEAPDRMLSDDNSTSTLGAAHSSSSSHSGSGHGSSGCWGHGEPERHADDGISGLQRTVAVCWCCFFVCSVLDHCNLILPVSWRFPISVLMFFAGLVIGMTVEWRTKTSSFNVSGWGLDVLIDGIKDTTFFDPHALLWIVLPPLLYESAASMEWHTLRKILPSAVMLALPGVVLNTILTSFYVRGVIRTGANYEDVPSWGASALLSTILSATDPVAVVAALSALGAPKKLASLVEGESLLNDGSAFVLFIVFVDWVADAAVNPDKKMKKWNVYCEGDPEFACVVPFFLRMALGGVAVGILAGILLYNWIKYAHLHHDPRLELSIVIMFIYMTFYIAESEWFKMSGVVAVVFLGFAMAIKVHSHMSHDARHAHHVVMSQIAYAANQVTFFFAGIISARFMTFETKCNHTIWASWRPTLELLGLYIFIHITRATVTLIFAPLLKNWGYGLNWKEGTVMVYGGLRGAVGLIMGLMVEHHEHIDPEVAQMVAFHTGGIVLLTLWINGSTVDTVYKWLDPYPQNPSRVHNLRKILEKVETESQKVGIKVITNDWFFDDCLFSKILQCVPNFGYIEFDESKAPVPVGIEEVDSTLSKLYPHASAFRKDQVLRMEQDGQTPESMWKTRKDSGDQIFLTMMESKKEVTSKSDILAELKTDGYRKITYSQTFQSGSSASVCGMYVSGFALDVLKKEEDDDYGYEVEIAELEGLDMVVGLVADQHEVRDLKVSDDCQILGIQENSIGFNCNNGKVTTNGPACDDQVNAVIRPLVKGDILSIRVTKRPLCEWEIEYAVENENLVVMRKTLGPFSPKELYPAIEFRPVALQGLLTKGMSGNTSSKSMGHINTASGYLAGGASLAGSMASSALGGLTSLVGKSQAEASAGDLDKEAPGQVNGQPERSARTGSGGIGFSSEANKYQAKVLLSFDLHPASDHDSIGELFHVFFNMLLNHYFAMHDSGTLCDKSLFMLQQCIGEAIDNANSEVNHKRVWQYMDGPVRSNSGQVTSLFPSFRSRSPKLFSNKTETATLAEEKVDLGSLYEPVLLEYLVLRGQVNKPSFVDKFRWESIRQFGYQETRARVEALWAFVEAHNKVIEESPAIERFPQFIEAVQAVVHEAHSDLVCIRWTQPLRFFYCKHQLALRMLFNRRLKKLKKFAHEGFLAHGDAHALSEALLERLNQVNLWTPRKYATKHANTTHATAYAWQDLDLGGSKTVRKSLSDIGKLDEMSSPPNIGKKKSQKESKDTQKFAVGDRVKVLEGSGAPAEGHVGIVVGFPTKRDSGSLVPTNSVQVEFETEVCGEKKHNFLPHQIDKEQERGIGLRSGAAADDVAPVPSPIVVAKVEASFAAAASEAAPEAIFEPSIRSAAVAADTFEAAGPTADGQIRNPPTDSAPVLPGELAESKLEPLPAPPNESGAGWTPQSVSPPGTLVQEPVPGPTGDTKVDIVLES